MDVKWRAHYGKRIKCVCPVETAKRFQSQLMLGQLHSSTTIFTEHSHNLTIIAKPLWLACQITHKSTTQKPPSAAPTTVGSTETTRSWMLPNDMAPILWDDNFPWSSDSSALPYLFEHFQHIQVPVVIELIPCIIAWQRSWHTSFPEFLKRSYSPPAGCLPQLGSPILGPLVNQREGYNCDLGPPYKPKCLFQLLWWLSCQWTAITEVAEALVKSALKQTKRRQGWCKGLLTHRRNSALANLWLACQEVGTSSIGIHQANDVKAAEFKAGPALFLSPADRVSSWLVNIFSQCFCWDTGTLWLYSQFFCLFGSYQINNLFGWSCKAVPSFTTMAVVSRSQFQCLFSEPHLTDKLEKVRIWQSTLKIGSPAVPTHNPSMIVMLNGLLRNEPQPLCTLIPILIHMKIQVKVILLGQLEDPMTEVDYSSLSDIPTVFTRQ